MGTPKHFNFIEGTKEDGPIEERAVYGQRGF